MILTKRQLIESEILNLQMKTGIALVALLKSVGIAELSATGTSCLAFGKG
jgi:hypothetical protein